ncbi:Hypothetical protein SRAE_X000218500 [Strongyloides ratti]|uniref:Uncharacterized protein n=1 Tax=Strongyloides ratti TaxID=34506 RepID=A0A090KX47_STRRB|nr:Hypothetical protein SRAE_X000218500 [Strongyloides ratti]CEF60447.1 Hypothetical protein SRAE_X000218500 [Strongyloides ratti]
MKGVFENKISITEYDIRGNVFAIFKKGDKNFESNYRFINALNSLYKPLMKYFNKCVRDWCSNIISDNQFAGKQGYDGALDIGITNRILQEMR